MTTIKAMKETELDPKSGKSKPKSGAAFPYFDLNLSIEVARVIHERAGGACTREQLAKYLRYSGTRNGSFLARVAAAKMFGLVEYDGENLRPSDRGNAILSPVMSGDDDRARTDAFLSVDLFRKVYEQFKGQALPPEVGLKNLLQTAFTIVPDRVVPTVRIMMDSAEQAGFFRVTGNRSRMVMPQFSGTPPTGTPVTTASGAGTATISPGRIEQHGGGSGGGGGGSDDVTGIDPAIAGLLKRLPPGGTAMTAKRRKALIDAFTNVVSFIYPDADDEVF